MWHFYPLCPKHQGLKEVPKVLGDKRFDKREGSWEMVGDGKQTERKLRAIQIIRETFSTLFMFLPFNQVKLLSK